MKFHRAALRLGTSMTLRHVTYGRCVKCGEVIYLYRGKWKHLGVK